MAIEISRSHPVPKHAPVKPRVRKGDGRQEAVLALQVGESFFIQTGIGSARILIWWARAKHPERYFYAEKECDGQTWGVRVWRSQ